MMAVAVLAACSAPTAIEDPPGTDPPSDTHQPPDTDSPADADPPSDTDPPADADPLSDADPPADTDPPDADPPDTDPPGADPPDADPDPDPPSGSDPAFWTMGYHPWWLGSAWTEYELSTLNKVMFFDLSAGADGTIVSRNGWPGDWRQLKRAVQQAGGYVLPTVSVFDAAVFTSIFSSGDKADVLREELLNVIDEAAVDGLHIDFEIFERVPRSARQGFVSFMRELRAGMDARERRLFLTAFTLALNSHDVYDEAALSEYLDYFVVQGYDFHWIEGDRAGPISPLRGWGTQNWQTVLDRYLKLGIPRSQIVMSVPYYGFEWPTETDVPGSRTRGPGIFTTYAPLPASITSNPPPSAREQAARFGIRRDSQSGSPYYVFEDSTGWYQGWFEDAESLRAKYEFVTQEGLGGVAIWPLGYGDESLAHVLREIFPRTSTVAVER